MVNDMDVNKTRSEIHTGDIGSNDLMAVLGQRSEIVTRPTSPKDSQPHTCASMQPPEIETEEKRVGTYISSTSARVMRLLETINGILPQITDPNIKEPLSKEYADVLTQSMIQLTTSYLDNTRDMPTYHGKDKNIINDIEQLKNTEKQFISLLKDWGVTYKPKTMTGSALYA